MFGQLQQTLSGVAQLRHGWSRLVLLQRSIGACHHIDDGPGAGDGQLVAERLGLDRLEQASGVGDRGGLALGHGRHRIRLGLGLQCFSVGRRPGLGLGWRGFRLRLGLAPLVLGSRQLGQGALFFSQALGFFRQGGEVFGALFLGFLFLFGQFLEQLRRQFVDQQLPPQQQFGERLFHGGECGRRVLGGV